MRLFQQTPFMTSMPVFTHIIRPDIFVQDDSLKVSNIFAIPILIRSYVLLTFDLCDGLEYNQCIAIVWTKQTILKQNLTFC